jgi:hypothetical protein
MKKILSLCLLAVVLAFSASAQTSKSTWLIGGSASFQSSNGSSALILNPNAGVFIKDKLALGAEGLLTTSGGFTSWAIGPYLRKYFAPTEKGSLFGQAGIAAGGYSNTSDVRLWVPVKLGYAVFLNRHTALEFAAAYNFDLGEDADLFVLGVGFQIHLGK